MKQSTAITIIITLTILLVPVAAAQTITINPTEATAKSPAAYTFNDGFLQLNTTGIYQWNWGDNTDNTTTTTPTATHTYNKEGTYTITITITATIDLGDNWNASTEWQQYIGTYTNTATILPTKASAIGTNLISNLTLFAVLPIIIGAAVLFLVLKSFNSGDNQKEILPAITATIVAIILTELVIYLIINIEVTLNL